MSKVQEVLGLKIVDYEYLINEYIPAQGREDMDMFIGLGFSDYNYYLWKIWRMGKMKQSFIEPFKKRIEEVFGVKLER